MQTIITKYLSPTASCGSRIKATCWRCSVTIPFPYELNCMDRHKLAAQTLADKLTENMSNDNSSNAGRWVIVAGGVLPDDTGYAFLIEWSASE